MSYATNITSSDLIHLLFNINNQIRTPINNNINNYFKNFFLTRTRVFRFSIAIKKEVS